MALSPVMKQYLEKKSQNEDAILFFRLGDFYEMFFDDALIVSRELDLVLTGKQCGQEQKAPMCGVPYHSADVYIGKLVEKGYKVVICEQTEDPALAKGLVSRDVVRSITPGTVIDTNQLNEGKNNYLASVYKGSGGYSFSIADISTGEVKVTDLSFTSFGESGLMNELCTFEPKEIISNMDLSQQGELSDCIKNRLHAYIGKKGESARYEHTYSVNALTECFGGDIINDNLSEEMLISLGALVSYIKDTQKTDITYLKRPLRYYRGEFMEIDRTTRRNLEINETMQMREKKGSLLWAIDETVTSMGKRMLRKWLDLPLLDANAIYKRLDAVDELTREFMLREEISSLLKTVLDLERIMTKIVYKTGGGRDMRAAYTTMKILPELKKHLGCMKSENLVSLWKDLDPLTDLCELIDKTIKDDPPFSVREGGFIKEGVNKELDRLNYILNNSKDVLSEIEAREKERTGIKNLKIGYNRVFGYYIEVSRSNINDVPADYIRKQTLTTGERFITNELKELETTILSASDKVNAIEYDLFIGLCNTLSANIRRIQTSADVIAKTDVYVCLAAVAVKNNYVRPEVDVGDVIDIKEGRHPVVEKFCGEGGFVPNDVYLDTKNNKLMMITGPNMAGKSTYMRSVAIICLLAQMGSFVPASDARIGIVDKLFTRVGASDDLAGGRSTFMLEMSEVSYILKNAGPRSLIIYDEIGRGTSTYDGMSIARAVAEYTVGKRIGARSLFATHYHELTELESECGGIVNYSITARKRDKGIVFLRKIVRGAADESYGIEVAQLANLPTAVIKRAREVLEKLTSEKGEPVIHKMTSNEPDSYSIDDYIGKQIIEKLRMTDTDTLSPRDALNLIYDLKKQL